ncbi:hypothetical protein J11TS1_14520 [Oceanobacillus sp. J11TS1]|nr:hypothetical protein J11TS1_14520 [Oceanobacillus sp. J11TS1]
MGKSIKWYRGEIVKYTCPCCNYKTLDEEPPDTMTFVKVVFGKMMATNINILMKQVLIIFHLEKHNKILMSMS